MLAALAPILFGGLALALAGCATTGLDAAGNVRFRAPWHQRVTYSLDGATITSEPAPGVVNAAQVVGLKALDVGGTALLQRVADRVPAER